MTASADNIADLTVAVTMEIGYKCQQADRHDSLTLQCHAARCPWVSGHVERGTQKTQASHVISISIGFFRGGLDTIDVTGINSRPRRKEKVQGWTPAFTLVILHRSADMLDTRHVENFPTGLPKFRQRTRVGVILS